ncbi:MAG: type II secretion system major pseudopilin GspG [Planctomycetota bacterium]
MTRQRDRAAQRRRALTLVELMVVVVILGILATTVTISVRDYVITGKQNAAKQELSQLVSALELYYLENGRYPTNDEGLAVLLARTEKHPDGLLRGGDVNDPWGHPYQYVCPGLHGSFDLVCYGADGREGGTGADADIASWDMK